PDGQGPAHERRDRQHRRRPRWRPRHVHAGGARTRDRRGGRRRVSTAGGQSLGPSRAVTNLAFRPARPDELPTCAGIWRTAINDYIIRLGQHEIPPEVAPVTRLFTHPQATDPDRFIVATTPAAEPGREDRVVGFASAIERERLW